MIANGPAAATRGRTALGDISNQRKYGGLDGKANAAKVRACVGPAPLRCPQRAPAPDSPARCAGLGELRA